MLIDFKQLPRVTKFIGLLKFETFAYCSVDIVDKVIFYYFRCDAYFLLSNKKPFYTGMFTKQPVLPYLCSGSRRHTQKLVETYDRIPSRRGHAKPLSPLSPLFNVSQWVTFRKYHRTANRSPCSRLNLKAGMLHSPQMKCKTKYYA